jgi:hypothetical protein
MNLAVANRKSAKDTLAIARRWLDEFDQVALATLVSTWGSSPVPVGGQLVVGPNGQFEIILRRGVFRRAWHATEGPERLFCRGTRCERIL